MIIRDIVSLTMTFIEYVTQNRKTMFVAFLPTPMYHHKIHSLRTHKYNTNTCTNTHAYIIFYRHKTWLDISITLQ